MQRPARVYQILVMLMYGDYSWLDRYEDGIMEFKTGQMAEMLCVRTAKVRESLRWLKEKNFLLELEMYPGDIRLKLAKPKLLFQTFGVTYED